MLLGRRHLLVGLLLLGGAVPAAAQEPLRVVVQYIAGGNLYLGAGVNAGIHEGDTLGVHRLPTGEALGSLLVLASTPDRAMVSFLSAPYSLTRGDTIAVTIAHATGPVTPVAVPMATAPPPRTKQRSAVTTNGSLSFDLDLFRTTTTGLGGDPEVVTRSFTTPSVGFRLGVQGLPNGWELRTSLRATQRTSTGDVVAPTTLVQVYEASIHRRSRSFELQFGRFFDPYEYFSGYWDGMMVHRGSDAFGYGVLLGYEPDRGNSGFRTTDPKVGVFIHLRTKGRQLRYRTELAWTRLIPSDTTPVHTLVGWSQAVQAGSSTFSNSIQMDPDPESGRWVVTRLLTRVSTRLGRGGTLYAGYTIQQPYLLGPVINVIPYRRDNTNAGLSVWTGSTSLSADISTGQQKGMASQWVYNTSTSWRSHRPSGFGTGLTLTYWTDQSSSGLLLSPSAVRRAGAADLELHYQFYRSTASGINNTSHALELGARLPLAARTQFSARARHRFGGNLQSSGVYAGLWYAF